MRKSLHAFALLSLGSLFIPTILTAGEESAPSLPDTLTEPKTGIELVLIEGGEFSMGADGYYVNEQPPHTVTVNSFYIGRYEVTQRQWELVMKSVPSRFSTCGDCPVEQVSWNEVQDFLRTVSDLGGMRLRLPTEAEWEYAAGGGAKHQKWPGTDLENDSGEYAWYSGNFSGKTRPVGLKIPNFYNLYDMGGNVGEWCADWHGTEYYRDSPVDNPRGPAKGEQKIVRGGSWLSNHLDTRVARRLRRSPTTRSPTIGFRVAADARLE